MTQQYVGEKQKSEKHGRGINVYADGCVYSGEWASDKQNGEGLFNWSDGNLYMGTFKSGKQEGFGSYTWPTGGKYEGIWENDKMSGFGKYRRNDGVMFVGDWKDDHQHRLGHRIQPERICYGPSKVWERKKIVLEVWNENKELMLSKDVKLYPEFAAIRASKWQVDVLIIFKAHTATTTSANDRTSSGEAKNKRPRLTY